MHRISGIWTSLAGRLALLLTIGMALVAWISLILAERAHIDDLARLRMDNVATTIGDTWTRLGTMPDTMPSLLANGVIKGLRVAPANAEIDQPSPQITSALQRRLGPSAHALGQIMPHAWCFAGEPANADFDNGRDGLPDCWLIRIVDPHGKRWMLSFAMPHFFSRRAAMIDPIYLLIIVVMSATLAFVITLLAVQPLRRLTRATENFSLHDDPTPVSEGGPREVRNAIATFNLMQQRVSAGHRERTGMLAAISHDLQTPLTRLQLRLDDVDNEALRTRLGADLSIMQAIVREGLELARSTDSHEPWAPVDIDSLLASIAADAVELGAAVEIGKTCGKTIDTRIDALTRCITNLVENAVKYGNYARIDCFARAFALDIVIADEGPGIPPEELERVFVPFARGEQSRSRATGGTGLGLTIARAQAKLFGADVTLENREGGGLVATVRIDLPAAPFGTSRPHDS